jgi:hypothetical protein
MLTGAVKSIILWLMWSPITLSELKAQIEQDLSTSCAEVLELFERIKVEPKLAEFLRSNFTDPVYIVAEFGSKAIYYDDIEDRFEVGRLIGCRIEGGSGQFTLDQALSQIIIGGR